MAHLFHWHWLSVVIKVILAVVVLLLSAILSYTFFLSISPPGLAIFPFAALSLTEGGLVAWLLIFTTMKHHGIKSLIALLMILFCFVTTITITFAELIVLFQDHSLVSNDTVKNGTLILLEFMLGMHVLAATADFLVGKIEWLLGEMKGHPKEEDPALTGLRDRQVSSSLAPTRALPAPDEELDAEIIGQNGNGKKKTLPRMTH